MKAKQYLRQVRWLDNTVTAKLEQLEGLKTKVTKITGSLNESKVQESKVHDKTANLVCKIVELDKEITDDIDKLIDLKREAMQRIDSIDNEDYQLILTLRYLNLKSWEQIAVEMNYAFSWVHKLHAKALIKFDELLAKEETKRDIKVW